MKKHLYLSGILFALTSINAAHAMEKGFSVHVGAQGGFFGGSSETVTNIYNAPISRADLGKQGFGGGVLMGFGYMFENCMYLGMEFNGSWGKTDAEASVLTHYRSLKMKDQYDFAACLGWGFKYALPFLRVGIGFGKWEASLRPSNLANTALPGGVNTGVTQSTTPVGFLLGMGTDFHVMDGMSVGFSYDHVWFGRKEIINQVFTLDPNSPTNAPLFLRVKPEVNLFKMRVKFMF